MICSICLAQAVNLELDVAGRIWSNIINCIIKDCHVCAGVGSLAVGSLAALLSWWFEDWACLELSSAEDWACLELSSAEDWASSAHC